MERVSRNLARVVLGKPRQIQLAVSCLVARGHLLLEDVPGVGKTTLAEALARSCALSFARIQFTADLLPADILGAQIFHAGQSRFEFRPGPLFHQLVLADELNRAPPRTQSALLEAMSQGQVTVDGVTHPLPASFTVVATQNPSDFSGTYPLPDSQLDRFLMRLTLGHPSPKIEAELLRTRGAEDPLRGLASAITAEELLGLQKLAAAASVDESVAEYAVRLATATREHPDIDRGASTRAALSLVAAAKAHALWDSRDFVTPGDVKAALVPTLSHRMLLKSAVQGAYARDEAAHLLEEIARKVPAPR
ncbi:MAG: AAA family ATPase [Myxococcales bacterium]|nr:AAA family ATPase [Myxococcales bacterium]